MTATPLFPHFNHESYTLFLGVQNHEKQNKVATHLYTNFISLFMGLLENEIHHLANLISSSHGELILYYLQTQQQNFQAQQMLRHIVEY